MHIHTYIYMHVYTYIYMYLCIYIHTSTCLYIHIHIHAYIYIHLHLYAPIYKCISVCASLSEYMVCPALQLSAMQSTKTQKRTRVLALATVAHFTSWICGPCCGAPTSRVFQAHATNRRERTWQVYHMHSRATFRWSFVMWVYESIALGVGYSVMASLANSQQVDGWRLRAYFVGF